MVMGECNFCKVSVKSWHGDVMLQIGLTTDDKGDNALQMKLNWGLMAVQTFGDMKDTCGDIFMLIDLNCKVSVRESAW